MRTGLALLLSHFTPKYWVVQCFPVGYWIFMSFFLKFASLYVKDRVLAIRQEFPELDTKLQSTSLEPSFLHVSHYTQQCPFYHCPLKSHCLTMLCILLLWHPYATEYLLSRPHCHLLNFSLTSACFPILEQ